MSAHTGVILRGWRASRVSEQHVLFPASHHPELDSHSCAHTKPRHTEASLSECHRRFSCHQRCAHGSDGSEGVRAIAFPTEATVGGLSGDAWPVSPWPVPRAQGQEVARGSWEDTSPPLFVSIKPPVRCFIQTPPPPRA